MREELLSQLNDRQREAVCVAGGPLLILAGAGSGKTRVITHRIAWLIREGIAAPREIVAVTFTNKAAGEMKERVAGLLGEDSAGAWVGTFHALCLRILRREGVMLGYRPGFVVYDTSDQLSLLRACMKQLGRDDPAETVRSVLHRISDAKNTLQTVEQVESQASGPGGELFARLYRAYQDGLRSNNAVDFDDLIMQTLTLFGRFPGSAERYASACRFLLVDEYQDTNHAQYRLIQSLARAHRNICCVGDEDQSIFSWRGADIKNILDFQRDYPEAKLIKLEQNYRSTETILAAASAVIANNQERIGKTLWTEKAGGDAIALHLVSDDRAEAEKVLFLVRSLVRRGRRWDDVAVLYRTNNQSRLFEEVFLRERVPHRVVGALRFYERKEIKDLVAYLRVLLNPLDDMSLARIVNVPARGIGKSTMDAILEIARAESLPLTEGIERAIERRLLSARAEHALGDFLALMRELRERAIRSGLLGGGEESPQEADDTPGRGAGEPIIRAEGAGSGVTGLLAAVMKRIGYAGYLEKTHEGDHEARLLNIDALTSAAAEYDEEGAPDGLQGFVDRSSLRSDTDDVQGDTGVTLLTVHSAKGLEFPVVIVTGLEENVFPHIRSSESRAEMEEERRLFYVAMTRAKESLTITAAATRRSFGDFVENPSSRFIDEIPKDLVVSRTDAWSSRSEYRPWASTRAGRAFDGGRSRGFSTHRGSARGAGKTARGERRDETLHYDPGSFEDGYAVGMKVVHPMFGRGTIAAVEGSGPSLKLTIRFIEGGTRKILPRHTTLTIGR